MRVFTSRGGRACPLRVQAAPGRPEEAAGPAQAPPLSPVSSPDAPNPPPPAPARVPDRHRWLGPLAVAAVVALTATASASLHRGKLRADAARHARLTERLQAEVQRRVLAYGIGLRAVRGVVSGSDEVDAETFRRAVQTTDAAADFPGVTRIAYAQAVPRAGVRAFVEAVRADGNPGYRPLDTFAGEDPPVSMLIRHAAPTPLRNRVLGLDLAREPKRREAAWRAVHREDVTVTAAVKLQTTAAGVASFLLFLPDFGPGPAPQTHGERDAALRGWVLQATRADQVFADTGRRVDDELVFAVWEGGEGGRPPTTLFESGLSAERAASGEPRPGTLRVDVPIGGHSWAVATLPGPEFEGASAAPAAATASGGLLLAGLLGLLLRGHARTLRTAEELAERMTRDLRLAASTDRLTGLPNRARIVGRIAEAIERERAGGERFAVLFLDFDRFKAVNDTLGHDAGDELLRQIGQRLRDGLGGGATAGVARARSQRAGRAGHAPACRRTAARLGGDEFVVLLEDVPGEAAAVATAERLLARLAEPYRLGRRTASSTASIGLAMSDPSHRGVAEVLREADVAMYEAKREAPGTCRVFDATLRGAERRRLRVEADLPGVAARGELRLQYQPIVRPDGSVASLEALVRWRHPTLGLVVPDAFIPLAEAGGEIVPMGAWILGEALRQFAAWRAAPGFPASACLSVNLSRRQLADPALCGAVAGSLDRHGVPPGRLHLEVTEREVMQDPEVALATLSVLRAAGVAIDLDDFGTGQSSLACLHRFPLDVLKVDRSFIGGLGTDATRTAVFRGVCELARTLGLSVVAEGVETPLQRDTVVHLGCDQLQGYGLSRPLDPDDALAFCLAASAGAPLRVAG